MSESKKKVLTEEQIAFFHENGYLVLQNFISLTVAEEMRKQASDWMDEFEKDKNIPIHLFTTDADQASQRTAYFQNSVRGIWPFFEEKAIDPSNRSLRYPYKQCINKIGHGTTFNTCSKTSNLFQLVSIHFIAQGRKAFTYSISIGSLSPKE